MEVTITHTAEILGHELDIEFTAECRIENDGIGDYEYWGSRGYDEGNDFAEIDSDVTWDESLFDTWQNVEIKKLAETDEVRDAIIKECEVNYL